MAFAYSNISELNHQIRFLLFEIGIALSPAAIESFILAASESHLRQLKVQAANDGLLNRPVSAFDSSDFIRQLKQQCKTTISESIFYRWQQFHSEVQHTIANQALARAYRHHWQNTLYNRSKRAASFWSWLITHHTAEEMLLFLEQWGSYAYQQQQLILERKLFSYRESLQYFPEFNAQVNLHWCALHHNQAEATPGYKAEIKQYFPKLWQIWHEHLLFKRLNPDDYYPIPVHPWQWRAHNQQQLAQPIDNKELILVMPHCQPTRPLATGDTLISPATSNRCLQTNLTSTRPEENCVNNKIMQQITTILEENHHYQQSLFIMAQTSQINTLHGTLTFSLSEHPVQVLQNNQQLIPLPAVFAHSPLSSKPLLLDLITASRLSPENYFIKYCQCILTSQLQALLIDKLAFMTKSQNQLLVMENAQPRALVLRNIEYSLTERDDFSPAGYFPLFIENTIHNNISILIDCLSHYYQLPEQRLWQLLANMLDSLMLRFKSVDTDKAIQSLKKALSASHWYKGSPLLTELTGKRGCSYLAQLNPMHDVLAFDVN
ncbi:IucA/IucC family protein [Legionella dresdenensis]|uniref:IucA/IucC family protein n=1 Tax=Legionella dresdenensis TaxID=450200 RepID=A0ABV8CF16_9GAMM